MKAIHHLLDSTQPPTKHIEPLKLDIRTDRSKTAYSMAPNADDDEDSEEAAEDFNSRYLLSDSDSVQGEVEADEDLKEIIDLNKQKVKAQDLSKNEGRFVETGQEEEDSHFSGSCTHRFQKPESESGGFKIFGYSLKLPFVKSPSQGQDCEACRTRSRVNTK